MTSDVRTPPRIAHRTGETSHEELRAIADQLRRPRRLRGSERRTSNFGQWNDAANGTAHAFADLGVREGAVAALMLPTSIDYAVCYQALMRLGAITSGINPRLGPSEVASILHRCQPRILIHEDDRTPPEGEFVSLARSQLSPLRHQGRPSHLPTPDLDRPVAVVWTSGTTREP